MSASDVAVLLIALNGPSHQVIWVNPAEVVSVRAPRDATDGHFGPETECILQTADGKLIAVADACDIVRKQLGTGGGFP
jgi:hypothetical protein